MIDKPGIYPDISAADYHADPCPEPSLSSSVLRRLLSHSPRHAAARHPRLIGDDISQPSGAFDLGTVAHAVLLGGESVCEPVDAPDWRSAGARDLRDAARAAGRIPLLADQWQRVQDMVGAAHVQLIDAGLDWSRVLAAGVTEATVVWTEGGIWCRARPDALDGLLSVLYEYKTTSVGAGTRSVERQVWRYRYDIQIAWYLRGLEAVGKPGYRSLIICQEVQPPYGLTLSRLSDDAMLAAQADIERGLNLWRECMESGQWPLYPDTVAEIAPVPWAGGEIDFSGLDIEEEDQ